MNTIYLTAPGVPGMVYSGLTLDSFSVKDPNLIRAEFSQAGVVGSTMTLVIGIEGEAKGVLVNAILAQATQNGFQIPDLVQEAFAVFYAADTLMGRAAETQTETEADSLLRGEYSLTLCKALNAFRRKWEAIPSAAQAVATGDWSKVHASEADRLVPRPGPVPAMEAAGELEALNAKIAQAKARLLELQAQAGRMDYRDSEGVIRNTEGQPVGVMPPTRADQPMDEVQKASHYNRHPSGIEASTITRHFSSNVGIAMNYIWRHEHKGTPLKDLRKSIWHLQDEVKRLEEAGVTDEMVKSGEHWTNPF